MQILKTLALGTLATLCVTSADAQSTGAHSRVVATFGDSTFWPEGIDADTSTGRLYVASVRHRTIAEIGPDGRSRELFARDRTDIGPIFGVRFDPVRRVLWASSSGYKQIAGSDSVPAALLQIRVSDGAIVKRWIVPPAERGHVLGDLAIGPRGEVYVSDSVQPLLYILQPGSDTLESIQSPLFRSLQGVAPTPDGKSVYLVDYTNGLLRLSLATREVTRIADGAGFTTRGCDGIVWHRGSIIAVQNGTRTPRIIRFNLTTAGDAITSADVLDENTAVADEPTIGTLRAGEFVYVANSQWEKFDNKGARVTSKALTSPVLLGVRLP
jgi:DNA-binding beta-propeller fold protein YncE